MIGDTGKFKVHDVVYNKNGFAVARGYWDGNTSQLRLACRWHEDGGLGYPQTFGKPQWMQLPEHPDLSVDIIGALNALPTKVVITLT
jgi:hypothetical protein